MSDHSEEFSNEDETLSSTVENHESENSKNYSGDEFELKLDDDGSESESNSTNNSMEANNDLQDKEDPQLCENDDSSLLTADSSSLDSEEDYCAGKKVEQLPEEKIYTSEEDTIQSNVEEMAQGKEEEILLENKDEIIQSAEEINQGNEEETSIESPNRISDDNIGRKASEEEIEQTDEKLRMQYIEERKDISEEETSQESKEQTSQQGEETESQTSEEEMEQTGEDEMIYSIDEVKEISEEETSQDSNNQTSQDEETGSQSNEEEFERTGEEFEQSDDTLQSSRELNEVPVSEEEASQDSNEHISQDEDTVSQKSEEEIDLNNEDVKIWETEDEKIQEPEDERIRGTKDEKMDEAEDEKIQKIEEENMQESEDEKMQKTEDEKMQEIEEEKMQEIEEEKVKETEDEKMQKIEEEKVKETEDEKMQDTEDERMQETEDEKMVETEDEMMQETEDEKIQEIEDKKIQETEDEKIQETEDEKTVETEDEMMQETKDEKMMETEDEMMQETEDENMKETEDEKMVEIEDEMMQKTEDEMMQKTEDEMMQKTEDKKIQETEDEKIQETEDEKIQETEDEKIQETEDEKIQETEDEKIQETEDGKMQETKDEKMVETEDEMMQKTEDEKMVEAEDERMQESEDEKMQETKDEKMQETKDEKMKETEDEKMQNTEEIKEVSERETCNNSVDQIQQDKDRGRQNDKYQTVTSDGEDAEQNNEDEENIEQNNKDGDAKQSSEDGEDAEENNEYRDAEQNNEYGDAEQNNKYGADAEQGNEDGEDAEQNIKDGQNAALNNEGEMMQTFEERKEFSEEDTSQGSNELEDANTERLTDDKDVEDAKQNIEDGQAAEHNIEDEMMQSVEERKEFSEEDTSDGSNEQEDANTESQTDEEEKETHSDEILSCDKVPEDGERETSNNSKDQILKETKDLLRQTSEGETEQEGIEETEQIRKEITQSSKIAIGEMPQDGKEEIQEDKETKIHANKEEITLDNVEKHEQTNIDEVEQESEEKAAQVMKEEMLKEVKEKKMDSSEKSEVKISQDSNEDNLNESDTEKSPVLGQNVKKRYLSLGKNKAVKSEGVDKDKDSENINEKESQANKTSPIIGSRSKDSPRHCTSRTLSTSSEERCDLVITSVQGNVSDFTSQECYSELKKVKPTISADKSNESAEIICESEDEVIFEECKAIVCQKCKKIWTDTILKAIFKGTEPVTVNSKITFGAIVLMNNWAFKNIEHNKDTAVRKVLERAGLGKNIKSMKMQKLSHWLSGLMSKGKIKCCAVFDAIYKPKPIKLSSVAKDEEMVCETLNVCKDVSSNKRALSLEEDQESCSGKIMKKFDPYWKVNVDNEEPLICKQLGIDINSIDISGSSTDTKRISNGTVFKQSSKKSSYAELRMLKERSRLYEFAKEAFDLLPFEPENFYTSSGNKPTERFMTNRELLTLHSIFILDAEYPDAELLYKSLSQILISRSQVLLIPDSRTLLQVLEKLRRDFNRAKARKAYSEFLSQNWDLRNVYSAEDVWSSRDGYPKNPTIGNILSLFCLWKNRRHDIYLSLSAAMEEMCKNTDLSSSDKLGICVRLYARFCTFLYKEDNPELAETFLCRKFTMSNISVTREVLLSDMRCSTSENYSFELSVTNTEKEITAAIQNCLEAEKIALQTENDKTLKHYQKLLKIFEQKLTQYREVNANIITKIRDAEARKQELVMKIQGPKSKILMEELSAGISTICKNKRKNSMLDKAHQTSVKRQKVDYITEVLGQGTPSEPDAVSEEMKEVIHEILSKGVKPELVRVVIQTVIKKTVGGSGLYLPDVIWIRKYAQDNGFLTKDT